MRYVIKLLDCDLPTFLSCHGNWWDVGLYGARVFNTRLEAIVEGVELIEVGRWTVVRCGR